MTGKIHHKLNRGVYRGSKHTVRLIPTAAQKEMRHVTFDYVLTPNYYMRWSIT